MTGQGVARFLQDRIAGYEHHMKFGPTRDYWTEFVFEAYVNHRANVILLAGLPDETSAMSINRFCSSGLEAIHLAALKVMSGTARCIVAGGAESMSMVPMGGNKFAPNPKRAGERGSAAG